MPDREKVIRGLTVCTDFTPTEECEGCPYQGEEYCTEAVMQDALDILRGQEPIRRSEMYFCGDCKTAIARTMNYCHKCGRKVDWNA